MITPCTSVTIKIRSALQSGEGSSKRPRRHPQNLDYAPRASRARLTGRHSLFAALTLLFICLCGCAPHGPRELLQGKKLIDQSKYTQAADKLRTATEILT